MDIKKALVTAVIWYALIFFIASILMFVLNLTGVIFGAAMVIFAAILAYVIPRYYYFKEGVDNPIKEGLLLCIVVVVISFLLEVLVMVYGFAKDQGWNYFNSWSIIVGYLIALIVPVVAAYQAK